MTETDPRVQAPAPGAAVRRIRMLPFQVLSLTLVILGIGAGYGYSRFGSIAAAFSAMRGDLLLVDQPLQSVDGIRPGARVTLRYTFTNVSGHPIKLIGATSSCTCTMMEDLPLTLAASETRSVTAIIKTRESPPVFDGSIVVYTDERRCAEIVLGYSLHLTSPDAGRTQIEKDD